MRHALNLSALPEQCAAQWAAAGKAGLHSSVDCLVQRSQCASNHSYNAWKTDVLPTARCQQISCSYHTPEEGAALLRPVWLFMLTEQQRYQDFFAVKDANQLIYESIYLKKGSRSCKMRVLVWSSMITCKHDVSW